MTRENCLPNETMFVSLFFYHHLLTLIPCTLSTYPGYLAAFEFVLAGKYLLTNHRAQSIFHILAFDWLFNKQHGNREK